MSIPQDIIDAALAFINAADKQSVANERWRELNTDEADRAIGHVIERYRGDDEALSSLGNMRDLLYRFRNEGIQSCL